MTYTSTWDIDRMFDTISDNVHELTFVEHRFAGICYRQFNSGLDLDKEEISALKKICSRLQQNEVAINCKGSK